VHGTGVPIMFPSGRRDQFTGIGEVIAFAQGLAIAQLTSAESPATEIENAIRHQPTGVLCLAVPWDCEVRGFDPDLLHAILKTLRTDVLKTPLLRLVIRPSKATDVC
jgi:hypothetical protein